MAKLFPFIHLINNRDTKFQPVYVLDVAKAIEKIISNKKLEGDVYSLGGPEILSFREVLDLIMINFVKEKVTGKIEIFPNLV